MIAARIWWFVERVWSNGASVPRYFLLPLRAAF